MKATEVRAGLPFPHAVQAVRIVRRRQPIAGGPATTETVYLVTSLPSHQTGPALLGEIARGHWLTEDRLHESATSPLPRAPYKVWAIVQDGRDPKASAG